MLIVYRPSAAYPSPVAPSQVSVAMPPLSVDENVSTRSSSASRAFATSVPGSLEPPLNVTVSR
jgi:hypothetical protein